MTERIQRLIQRVRNTRHPICTKKFQIAHEVLKNNADAMPYMKRVLLLEAYLDQMPVFIPDDELIVGEGASKPYGIELNYEFGMWSSKELLEMQEECTWCYMEEDDLAFALKYNAENEGHALNLTQKAVDYFKKYDDLVAVQLSGLIGWKSLESGVHRTAWGNAGIGHFPNVSLAIPLYTRVLNKGARSIIDSCKAMIAAEKFESPDSLDKIDFWEGLIRVYEAWIRFANRYADKAEEMAVDCRDSVRAAELKRIAEICRRVPEYPARNFREAVQAFWFTWIMMPSPTNSVGRFDQYMYPFYKKDIEEGTITKDEALELLENIKTRCQSFVSVRGSQTRMGSAGGANWFNFTIGGVDSEGKDATNDLTYLLLEASLETQLPHHTLTLRVHENTPELLMKKAMDVVKTGLGMPAFISDKEYISFFMQHGATLEEARDYAISGCLDGNLPGKTRISGGSMLNNPEFLDIFMHNGYSRFSGMMAGIETGDPSSFETFEDFLAGYYRQQHYLMEKVSRVCNVQTLVNMRYNQDPFFSGLMEGCIEEGKELTNRKCSPYDNLMMHAMVGAINAVDSLAAIKYWIYDKKKYTMAELITAIDNDWNGYEEMRRDFKAAPKFGNDDDYVDSIAVNYYKRWAEDVEAFAHPWGHGITAGISVSTHQMIGSRTAATPEGRKAFEIMADGSVSPEQGADHNGPLAGLRSAMKIDHSKFNATLLNHKYMKSALATDADELKLAAVVRTYLTNGGKHIQFNVVDKQTLLNAQAEPEKYRDLIVRVAGYSAYFTNLTKMVQQEVIDRTDFA
ncbi:MAG: hypothetical protein IJ930_09720 [Lachnospiraceae bacterium]|nr:hypothetical protein [Lachnospiraceae bacterium]